MVYTGEEGSAAECGGKAGIMAEQYITDGYGWPVAIGSDTISFDGFQFGGSIGGMVVPYIEMAYRARRGDAVAAEILNSFKVIIYDANEKTYWPMDGSVKTPADRVATVSWCAAECGGMR